MNALYYDLLSHPLWLIAQGAATGDGTVGEGSVDGTTEASTGAPDSNLITQILGNPLNLILISGILFILLVLRPQQQQMKALQSALSDLKKNDRIVTSGGIHGTVVQSNSEESPITVRIDDNSGARITMNRDAVAKILTEDKE